MTATLTPLKAIRKKCRDCSEIIGDIRECWFTDCPIYPYRMGKRPEQKAQRTPIKAIRAKCLDCCLGSALEVRGCSANCPLQPYKMGKRPSSVNSSVNPSSSKNVEIGRTFSANTAMLGGVARC